MSDTSPSTVYFVLVNAHTTDNEQLSLYCLLHIIAYLFICTIYSGCSCTEGVSENTDSVSVVGVLSLIIILIIGVSALVIIILLIKIHNLKAMPTQAKE